MTGVGLRSVVAVALALLVSGCDDSIMVSGPVAAEGPKAALTLTPDLRQRLLDAVVAVKIAEECPRNFTADQVKVSAVYREFERSAGAQGYRWVSRDAAIAAIGGPEAAQAALRDYVSRHHIVFTAEELASRDYASFCNAGYEEMRAQTGIGKFMAERLRAQP